MVNKDEYRKAMVIVSAYAAQIKVKPAPSHKSDIGSLVCRNAYGKQNGLPSKKGKVIDYLPWNGLKDGLVTVKWDGIKKPDIMHIDNVELVKLK